MTTDILRTIVFGLITVSYSICNGQSPLTKEENDKWVTDLRAMTLDNQLGQLRTRILADTNVYVKNTGDRIILKPTKYKDRNDGICRPILVVDGYIVIINNDTDTDKVRRLCSKLTTQNIQTIEILDDNYVLGLYGSSGQCGVITLKPKTKRLKGEIKKIGI